MDQTYLILGGVGLLVLLIGLALWIRRRRRRERTPWLGPLFRYELVRLARRGQQMRLRVVYVILLFVGMLAVYANEFGQHSDLIDLFSTSTNAPIAQSAKFAENFLVVFLCLQAFAVVLLTPAIVGGAIAEDKERGAFDHLRASLLSNREIVLGKLAARLVYIGSVLVTGLPVLALTLLFGGVDGLVLLAGFAVCGVGTVSIGSYSIYLAVQKEGMKEVLFHAYAVVGGFTIFGLCCGCVPILGSGSPLSTIVWMLFGGSLVNDSIFWLNVGVFLVLHSFMTLIFLILAVVEVRPEADIQRRRRTRVVPRVPKRAKSMAITVTETPNEVTDIPVAKPIGIPLAIAARPNPRDVEDEYDLRFHPTSHGLSRRRHFTVPRLRTEMNPFLWKERYFSGRMAKGESDMLTGFGAVALATLLMIVGTVMFFVMVGGIVENEWHPEQLNPMLRILGIGGVLAIGLIAGVRSCAAVARESQRSTLVPLLMIPVDRRSLLEAKWLAAAYGIRYPLVALGFIVFGGLISVAILPIGLMAIGLAVAYLAFSITLGIWLSVRSLTVPRATTAFLLATLGLWIGPPAIGGLMQFLSNEAMTFGLMFSPPAGLWLLMPSIDEWSYHNMDDWKILFIGSISCLTYLLLAGFLWFSAARQFNAEGK